MSCCSPRREFQSQTFKNILKPITPFLSITYPPLPKRNPICPNPSTHYSRISENNPYANNLSTNPADRPSSFYTTSPHHIAWLKGGAGFSRSKGGSAASSADWKSPPPTTTFPLAQPPLAREIFTQNYPKPTQLFPTPPTILYRRKKLPNFHPKKPLFFPPTEHQNRACNFATLPTPCPYDKILGTEVLGRPRVCTPRASVASPPSIHATAPPKFSFRRPLPAYAS